MIYKLLQLERDQSVCQYLFLTDLQVQRDIQKMIEAHQQLPGSIISALRARWKSSKQQ